MLHNLLCLLKGKAAVLATTGFSFLMVSWASAQEAATPAASTTLAISAGDTAWVLASAALVMLMTPGLGLFYGGMVRRKNVLGTIMQSFFLVALISVQWVIWGYSLAFHPGNSFLGGTDWFFLKNIGVVNPGAPTIPHYAFVLFQAMFAIITPALITGAYAERVSFKAFVLFSLLWATLVYDPVCHWILGGRFLGEDGWLGFRGRRGRTYHGRVFRSDPGPLAVQTQRVRPGNHGAA